MLIELDEKKIISRGGRSLDLNDPRNLKRLIDAGLRAQLEMESILTGLLYVELDMHPGNKPEFVLRPTPRSRKSQPCPPSSSRCSGTWDAYFPS